MRHKVKLIRVPSFGANAHWHCKTKTMSSWWQTLSNALVVIVFLTTISIAFLSAIRQWLPLFDNKTQATFPHNSSTNGVFTRCPLLAIVFLPDTNFFAACRKKNTIKPVISNILSEQYWVSQNVTCTFKASICRITITWLFSQFVSLQ